MSLKRTAGCLELWTNQTNRNEQSTEHMPRIVAYGLISKGNGEVILSEEKHMSLSTGGGQAGQGYPCVLILNDQGGGVMHVSYDITSTLRSQTKHHEPIVLIKAKKEAKSVLVVNDESVKHRQRATEPDEHGGAVQHSGHDARQTSDHDKGVQGSE